MKAVEIQQRREKILSLLKQQQKITVQSLVELLNVSDETIRKDLAILTEQGMIKKSYGVAELIPTTPVIPVGYRDKKEADAKSAIAKKALSLIKPTMRTIGLDQGSTIAKLAEYIKELHHKTIITRSLPSLIALKDGDNEFFTPGGYYNANDMSFQGQGEDNTLANIHLDISFFGSSGLKSRHGICSSSFTDAEFKKQMNLQSSISVALIDHTKFTQTSLVMVLPWTEFDLLITDDQTPENIIDDLKKQVEVIVAN
ncbi:DeoR/GlpR family DNA-binding transcription regulator [Xylocopilactobacillus apis]|uniref:DeoR family transcriptional regulator n=1 Tax=Xylocopilactobacillus apis TaxID=2932183 RepID=A0AAU9D3W0_9LACO|nr:DeoR/GlpR family DNA-binding transcription regulator [Xylocopilactobacillus apis]BDR55547.1 DeoR family transcriptional regulator [Xylocopilactobacillus apis]